MQQIHHGIGKLPDALNGSEKVLLVCDASFPFLSIRSAIEKIGIPYVTFCEFTPNPLYDDVCKGVYLFNTTKCDSILAIGGGSSIDVAKCIKLYCKMSKDKLFLEQEYKDTGIKLIAIPTTAGTGSESTRFAVIYYDGKKQSVSHDSIIPDVAILEPTVLKTLPLYQKKCTMLDALCQGIESWWSINSTDESKKYSKFAVETIMQWWLEYIFENTDESARHIMEAANYAGRAICITQTTAPHAFSYKLTSLYGLPHGYSVAVCLPVIWEYMISHLFKYCDIRGKDYVESVFQDISKAMNARSPQEAITLFKKLMSKLELPNPISDSYMRDIQILTSSVNPIRLKNNPIELNSKEISELYKKIVM